MTRAHLLRNGGVGLLLAVVLFPAWWMLQLSFRASGDIFDLSFTFTPTFDNYRALWTGLFPGSFSNSIIVSLAGTALSLLLGVPAAYALSRCRFRARRRRVYQPDNCSSTLITVIASSCGAREPTRFTTSGCPS